MSEVWKYITGFEGKYQISDRGRVKSIGRMIGNGQGYFKPELILNMYTDADGYLHVTLVMKKRKVKRFSISRLVAKHFLDKEIDERCLVCHKDNNKVNNRADNLYIGNLESNTIDKYNHGSTKLSIENTRQIRAMSGKFTQAEIAKRFGVKQPCVSRIIHGKRGVFIN